VWIRKYTPSTDEELMNLDNYTVNVVTNDEETQSLRTLGPFMHYDYNSNYHLEENNKNYSTPDLASLVVTLNNADEYEGGEIVVSDGFHSQSGIAQLKTLEKSNAGEGVLWDGWTLHGVNPVTSGVRYIMVVHFQGKMR
jgi:predicted 2-oxoglutarate/Fe(II)-dependent dioxygenase YbiX